MTIKPASVKTSEKAVSSKTGREVVAKAAELHVATVQPTKPAIKTTLVAACGWPTEAMQPTRRAARR